MGRFEMEDIMASPGLDNLHIIESGPIPANPSELLSTPTMNQFLREVREEYDVVLIDTPPVLPVTDSAIVAGQADGVILVYQAGKVGRLVLKRAKAHLESARAKVWGVVLNDVQTEIAGYAYSHYYTHYYGEETPGDSSRGSTSRWLDGLRSKLAGFVPRGQRVPEPASRAPEHRGTPRRSRSRPNGPGTAGSWRSASSGWCCWPASSYWSFGSSSGGTARRPRASSCGARWSRRPPSRRRRTAPATPTPPSPSTSNPERTDEVAALPTLAPPLAAPSATPLEARPAAAAKPEFQSADAGARTAGREARLRPADAGAGTRAGTAVCAGQARQCSPPLRLGPSRSQGQSGRAGARHAASGRGFHALRRGVRAVPHRRGGERVERQLSQAGHQTVRFRQQTGAALYAVLIERVADPETLTGALREQGFSDAAVVRQGSGPSVRVGEPMVLRGAVQLAERLRAQGHQVRIAAQPGEAIAT